MKDWKEQLHIIMQEEISGRAIYESRLSEETLRRGMQTAESRLESLVVGLLASRAELIRSVKVVGNFSVTPKTGRRSARAMRLEARNHALEDAAQIVLSGKTEGK